MSEKVGRRAIDWIKAQYLEGHSFTDTRHLMAELVNVGVRPGIATATTVCEWDRQARYELYRDKVFVTPPVQPTGYVRTPVAGVDMRAKSMATRKRYLTTAISNLTEMQAAAAAQVDATRVEIQDEAELRMALSILIRVRERMDRHTGS